MTTLEQWISQWEELTDSKEKSEYINNIPEELKNDETIKAIKSWFDIRYFFVDKSNSRIGDKFVWLFLTMYGQSNNKVGQREMLRVYNEIFDKPETKEALKLSEAEFQRQMLDAAQIYVSTLGEPPSILGIIPRKDKSPKEKENRIAKLIVEDHFKTVWKAGKDLPYMPLIVGSLNQATLQLSKDMVFEIRKCIELSKEDGFKNWLKDLNI